MADIHIEDFYRDAGLILTQLYDAFPRRTSVYVEDIAGEDQPDEYGLHGSRHMACFGTLLWLAEEGFIRYLDTIGQIAVDQAVLTQPAFVRLASISHDPALVEDPATEHPLPDQVRQDYNSHINLIRRALRSGHSHRISQVVHQILFGSDKTA